MTGKGKTQRLVLLGDSALAEIAYEYFTHDSPYDVVAFSVEREYLERDSLFGLPIVPFDELERAFPPTEHHAHAAISYRDLNRVRARLAAAAKGKGYELASYVSSNAFVWRNVELGEHCFIFENNVVQPFVKVGRNVVMWSGNHIGHHSTIGDNCFISSHVVVSGFVTVGKNCFLGVNSTIANNIEIGDDTWLGPSSVVTKDSPPERFYKPPVTEVGSRSPLEFFGIERP